MKLKQIIFLCKFIWIKSKTRLFLNENRLQTISWNNKIIRKYQKNVDQDKDRKNVPKLEPVEVLLVHCILINNSYQQASKVLFTFLPDKQFGKLITISNHSLTKLKTTNAEFQSVEL